MKLHGTNIPFPIGTILSSSKSRNETTRWSNSRLDAVYFADTEYDVPKGSEDHVPRYSNEDYPEDAAATKKQKALMSAVYYGVGAAVQGKIHPLSQSLTFSKITMMTDADGEPNTAGIDSMTDADVDRVQFNRKAAGLPDQGYLKEAEWEALSEEDRDAYNAKYEDMEERPAEELRGYWVYEVEIVEGIPKWDKKGEHPSNYYVENGQLRITNVVIADGAVVDPRISLPHVRSLTPKPNEKEMKLIRQLTERREAIHHANEPLTGEPIQCRAQTTKKTPCKRMTSTGRCYQHHNRKE
jgi:hypothetical protein